MSGKSIVVDAAAERRLVEIADLLWQVQKRFSRRLDLSPLTREEIDEMMRASSDIHGILNPTPGLGRHGDPPKQE